MKIEVYDPAMCCSTGVCGPSVDPALATFASDLASLATSGVAVQRFNLGQEPGAFVSHREVRTILQEKGEAGLPAVFVNGELCATGRYPSLSELSVCVGLEAPRAVAASACCGGPVATPSASGNAAPQASCC
jgi:hypothetical protein